MCRIAARVDEGIDPYSHASGYFVGADAHIRPAAFMPLRGRVDEGIDPYKPSEKRNAPVGADDISARALQFRRCLPGRIYNAPLQPRARICRGVFWG